jgi:hypoxanthine phosphoribosyltransferase
MIKIKDKNFQAFISEESIQNRVAVLAKQISADYEGRNPVLISVLSGALFFTADLMRLLTIDASLACVKVNSYKGLSSTGNCELALDTTVLLEAKDIIIIEDIIDTGNTMHFLMQHFQQKNPTSIAVASLLFKPAALVHTIKPDYVGFEIEPIFVVGYGLDYDQVGRGLPAIYQLIV